MGFNKKILPPLDIFKKMLKENPSLLENISKADAIMGPVETMAYLKKIWNDTPELPEAETPVSKKSSFFEL